MSEQDIGQGASSFSPREPLVTLLPVRQESEAPVKDSVTSLDKLFYLFGKVTRPSSMKTEGDDPNSRMQRSLLTRNKRAELLKKVLSIPSSDSEARKEVFKEAHEWDRLAHDFLNQGEVRVSLPGLGEQTACYSILNPQAHTETESQSQPQAASEKPPIIIIPGISNDLDCVANIAQSLAFRGRKVISISYPEAFMGSVTDEFADEIVRKKDLSEHTRFFQTAINSLTEDLGSIELWGLSTGGPIVAEMLSDPEMQQKVANAVLISPAACVEQGTASIKIGTVQEVAGLLKRFGNTLPKVVMTTGRKEGIDDHQVGLRKKIFNSLFETISHNVPYWSSMRVQDDGNIVVISGGKDQITKSYKAIDQFQENQQVHAVVLPNENHNSTFNSEEVLDNVQQLQAS